MKTTEHDMQIVLNTYGTILAKGSNVFVIKDYEGIHEIPIGTVTSFLVSKGITILSDAMFLAIDNEVEIIFSSRSGKPAGRVWSPKYGSISSIRKGQLIFCNSHKAVEWIIDVLATKIENQQALISMFPSANDTKSENMKKTAINRLSKIGNDLRWSQGELVADVAQHIRGLEGTASRVYFDIFSTFLPERLQFDKRTQHPARDVANALLNYGYGVLYSLIESDLIKSGIDPYIGVLHRDEYSRPVLVYDVIEMYRMWVDWVVFQILFQDNVTDEFYSTNEDGSVWLESLGKRVLIQTLNDYLDDVINLNGMKRSRRVHMLLYAQKLAQTFKSSMKYDSGRQEH